MLDDKNIKEQTLQIQKDGFCIIPNVLGDEAIRTLRKELVDAATAMQERGITTHTASMDPNAHNVRVYSLPAISPIFGELLRHKLALRLCEAMLGPHLLVSNFTANIALPGSKSMRLHSDQALTVPPPWNQIWAANIIWCLDDVYERNGATRYLPGSHLYSGFDDVPVDADQKTVAFEAPAGSLIAMEGRLWHTSGANVSKDAQRAMLFAYYTTDFIRPQINWESVLPASTKDVLDEQMRHLLGIGAAANTRLGAELTRLQGSGKNLH
jgi:ectoine hydroxylase-related dioxygenase (phytanoyl-CoA dioxygenase family)